MNMATPNEQRRREDIQEATVFGFAYGFLACAALVAVKVMFF